MEEVGLPGQEEWVERGEAREREREGGGGEGEAGAARLEVGEDQLAEKEEDLTGVVCLLRGLLPVPRRDVDACAVGATGAMASTRNLVLFLSEEEPRSDGDSLASWLREAGGEGTRDGLDVGREVGVVAVRREGVEGRSEVGSYVVRRRGEGIAAFNKCRGGKK